MPRQFRPLLAALRSRCAVDLTSTMGFSVAFYTYNNHSVKTHRFELPVCNRQTDGRTDGWPHCLMALMDGVSSYGM